MVLKISASVLAFALCVSTAAKAESELTVYGGWQNALDSDVHVRGAATQDFSAKWEGRSFKAPPYYGIRYTQWLSNNWGIALNFTHTKVYASDATKSDNGFSTLELTDGINPITLNAIYRTSQTFAGLEPYVGVGAGISIPHVELQKDTVGAAKTFEYQYGGPVAAFLAGVKYPVTKNWAISAEYHFQYYWLSLDMKPSNTVETDLATNALSLGVAYKW